MTPRAPRIMTATGAIRGWWAVLMVLIASALVMVICIGFTVHANRESQRRFEEAQKVYDRQWCGVLDILDKPLPAAAPQRSQAILREIHQRRVTAGC